MISIAARISSEFPVLTKAELRAWMKEMYDTHPESRDSWDATSTSGSTGVPLTLCISRSVNTPVQMQTGSAF